MASYAYLDTSALAMLAVWEKETPALENDLLTREGLFCSRMGEVELRRAAARHGARSLLSQVDEVLAAVYLLDLTPAVIESAGALKPAPLRSLDAIHLATAATAGERDIDFITYDDRLAAAARQHGLNVVMPGR